MSEVSTIILTSGKPGLEAVLADWMPSLRVVTADRVPPPCRPQGRTWCFVDWLLPDLSGLEMCRRLREASATADSHITMILEEDDSDARRRALRAGADDYLLAPLTAALLLDRLRLHRDGTGKSETRISNGNLTLDLAAHQVRWEGRPIRLQPNAFRLLAHFIAHPDQVFSRTALIAVLGKDAAVSDERTVDVWVGRLRRRLLSEGAPDPLRTVRSAGYVLDSVARSHGLG
jgi:two-component system phosphate regulon response regulator PhoB